MPADPVLQELLNQGFEFRRPLLTAKQYWKDKRDLAAAGIQTISPWQASRLGIDGSVSAALYEEAVVDFLADFRRRAGDSQAIKCFFTPTELLYHFELPFRLDPLRASCFEKYLNDIEGIWRLQIDELNAVDEQRERDEVAESLSASGVPYVCAGMHELDLYTLLHRFEVPRELWPSKKSSRCYPAEPPQIQGL